MVLFEQVGPLFVVTFILSLREVALAETAWMKGFATWDAFQHVLADAMCLLLTEDPDSWACIVIGGILVIAGVHTSVQPQQVRVSEPCCLREERAARGCRWHTPNSLRTVLVTALQVAR